MNRTVSAIDRNNPLKAKTAVALDWPESLSNRARWGLRYLGDTAFLFAYDGSLVVTDESGELTVYGDGSADAPFGGPRWTGANAQQLGEWLEAVAADCGM